MTPKCCRFHMIQHLCLYIYISEAGIPHLKATNGTTNPLYIYIYIRSQSWSENLNPKILDKKRLFPKIFLLKARAPSMFFFYTQSKMGPPYQPCKLFVEGSLRLDYSCFLIGLASIFKAIRRRPSIFLFIIIFIANPLKSNWLQILQSFEQLLRVTTSPIKLKGVVAIVACTFLSHCFTYQISPISCHPHYFLVIDAIYTAFVS